MYRALLVSIAAFAVLPSVMGQPGAQCHTPVLTPRHYLDMERFSGEWFMIQYAPFLSELVTEPAFTCLKQIYNTTDDPQMLELSNRFIRLNGSLGGGDTPAFIADPAIPALWHVEENGLNFTIMVLGTDYDNWAYLYGCSIFSGVRIELNILHSRQRTLDPVHRDFVSSLMVGMGFPPQNVIPIDQTGCTNFADEVPEQASVFGELANLDLLQIASE